MDNNKFDFKPVSETFVIKVLHNILYMHTKALGMIFLPKWLRRAVSNSDRVN